MPEECKYDLLRTSHELEDFQSSWRDMWSEDTNATPFQSPEWLLPWWHRFGQPELLAVVISCHGRHIAFLPFYIFHEPLRKERQLLLLGAGTTDYLDGVFAPGCGAEPVQTALDLLRDEGGWDVLYACQLRTESILFRALHQMNKPAIRSFPGESCSRMQALRMAELPPKIRRNAMYYRNRAMRLGTLELITADERSWPVSFDALVRLHTARWRCSGESGVLADERVLACHGEAIPLLQKRGMLRLCSLYLNGEIVGVGYALIDLPGHPKRTQYIYLTAHSVEHAELRPGTLLLALMMERAAEEGIETIDMLRGDEAYKKLWHVEPVSTYGFAISCGSQGGRFDWT